jgi:hypothetical protein
MIFLILYFAVSVLQNTHLPLLPTPRAIHKPQIRSIFRDRPVDLLRKSLRENGTNLHADSYGCLRITGKKL